MANKIGSKHGEDDQYPTTADVIRTCVEAQDHVREIKNKIYTPQARSANFVRLLDDLEQHSNENKPFKFEEIMMGLMADAETGLPGGGKYGDQKMLHFFNKHAASRGLDAKSVALIKAAAKRDRRLAGDGLGFTKLQQELRIQLRVMVAAVLRGVAIIVLYLALFFVLYKIFF